MADGTQFASSSLKEAEGSNISGVLSSWREQVLERVGGFDNVVDALLANLELVLAQDTDAVRGIFLYGPPGSGKSHLAAALATAAAGCDALGAPEPVEISAAVASTTSMLCEFRDKLAAVTSRAQTAPRHRQVMVLVLERAESLSAASDEEGTGLQLDPRLVVYELINSTIRCWQQEALPAVLLVPWAVTAPVPTELSAAGVFEGRVALPTPLGRQQRLDVLRVCTSSLPLGDERQAVLDFEADATPGFLPCDLSALCRSAALAAVRRCGSGSRLGSDSACHAVCLTRKDFVAARMRMSPTPMRGASSAAKPKAQASAQALQRGGDAGLAAIVGQSAAVKALQAYVVQPFQNLVAERAGTKRILNSVIAAPDPPIGILLCGPPGAGKTHVAVQLASELGAHVFAAAPADILASRVGDAEKRMAALFDSARRCAPSVVILEDVDALIAAADDATEAEVGAETRVGLVLRAELDTLRLRRAAHKKLREGGQRFPLASEALVLVIATACERCNLAGWLLAPHRLSQTIELEPSLSEEAVAELLRRFLHEKVADEACIPYAASHICRAGKGNGAAVTAFCRTVATQAVRRHVTFSSCMGASSRDQKHAHSRELSITIEDVSSALRVT